MAAASEPRAIFLTGPIGAGKSSLGRALAEALGGDHVEGDDHQQLPKPWYASSLSTCRATLHDVLSRLELRPVAVISYPLRCYEWLYYRRHLGTAGVATQFVALAAAYEALAEGSRARVLTASEKQRTREMLRQGYDRPPFADILIRTDDEPFAPTLARLLAALEHDRKD